MRRERDSPQRVPLLVLQNRRNCTVLVGAATQLRDAELAIDGGATRDTPAKAKAAEQPCTPVYRESFDCRHTFYTVNAQPGSRPIVETVIYDGPLETPDASGQVMLYEGVEGRWYAQRPAAC